MTAISLNKLFMSSLRLALGSMSVVELLFRPATGQIF